MNRTLIVLAVVVLVVLGSSGIRAYRMRPQASQVTHGSAEPAKMPIAVDVGDVIQVPGITYQGATRVLVIAFSADCPACQASESGLEAMAIAARRQGIPVYGIEANQRGKLEGAHLIFVNPGSVGITRVPSVLLLDGHGVIQAAHTGLVTIDHAQHLFQQLLAADPQVSSLIGRLSASDWKNRENKLGAQLIDLRRPGEAPSVTRLPGGLDIMEPDLLIRSQYELKKGNPVVVDCRPIGAFRCQTALIELRSLGFSDLAGIDLPRATPTKVQKRSIFDALKGSL